MTTSDATVDALAAYRLTRLVVIDSFPPVAAARDWVIARSETRKGYLAELVTCPYCSAVWVAAGVTAARRLFPRAWSVVGSGLALAASASFLVSVDDRLVGDPPTVADTVVYDSDLDVPWRHQHA